MGLKQILLPSYIISPVSGKDKFTEELLDCTSIIAVGRDTSSGKEISILTHQDPKHVLKAQKETFTNDLKERLKELKDRCQEGSIDIVIAGGKLMSDSPEYYKKVLEELSLVVEELFEFKPLVICGPKYPMAGQDNIYFDTQNRRLYIVRPKYSNFSNEVFKTEDAEKMQKKWKDEGVFLED